MLKSIRPNGTCVKVIVSTVISGKTYQQLCQSVVNYMARDVQKSVLKLIKNLKIMKITDLFVLNELKFLYKLENEMLPEKVASLFQKASTSRYNLRRQNKYIVPRVKHKFAEKCLRVSIPLLAQTISAVILDKMYTHSFKGFLKYVKLYYMRNYAHTCNIPNCYICRS